VFGEAYIITTGTGVASMTHNNKLTNNYSNQLSNSSAQIITPRRMDFSVKDMQMDTFAFENNSLISTFFYALSAMFPAGERFFIHSVRTYQNEVVSDKLKAQISGFIGQEAHHGHSHDQLNDAIGATGIPLAEVSQLMENRVVFLKRHFGPERQLALTVAMEHFTASLAEYILENSERFDTLPKPFRNMLIWHAVEEIEHKAVAFDVYREKVNDEFMRRRVMVIAMITLFSRLAYFQVRMLIKTRHLPSWKEWKEAGSFFWGKKGLLKANWAGLKLFFKRDFHPWDIDQHDLIDGWEERYPEIAALQTN
jgi:predicted metal-dependent hydrolase